MRSVLGLSSLFSVFRFLLGTIVFSSPFSSFAQWRLLGLDNESVSAIAIDPVNPEILYAGSLSDFSGGTVGGVFKSEDGGGVWDTLTRGLNVSEIAIHPTSPGILYVTSFSPLPAVLKSTDAGFTWMPSDSGILLNVETSAASIAIHPLRPDTLYCGTVGFFGGGLYKSTNGGAEWYPLHCDSGAQVIPCNLLRGGVASLTLDPFHPDTLYVGAVNPSYILKSIDGGNSWNFTGYTDYRVPDVLAVSLEDPQVVFAGISQEGLYVSTDEGLTWERTLNGLPDTAGTVVSISQELAGQLYCAFASLAQSRDVFFSGNNGGNWSRTGFPLDDFFYGDITYSPGNGLLYAGGTYGIFVLNPTDIGGGIPIPHDNQLLQNYPNPFNSSTTISFEIPRSAWVEISLHDVLGRLVASVCEGMFDPGQHRVQIEAGTLSSGIYFYEIRTLGQIRTRKMVLQR